MNRQIIKSTIICIGIIVGLLASGFLLVQELSAVPITYASSVGLAGNHITMQNIFGVNSIYSNFFFGANKQIETMNDPIVVESVPIKVPVKKITVVRAISGTKCPAKKDRPSISSRNNKNHMDEDCCSDYDEWPKPGCAYTAKDFQIMLPGPTPGHKKHK